MIGTNNNLTCYNVPNPRINADAPPQFFSGLGFKSRLSLVANSTSIRAPVMRNAVNCPNTNSSILNKWTMTKEKSMT